MNTETIAAIATAPGRGGVGIVRVSGPKCSEIAAKITKQDLKPRYATYTPFYHPNGHQLDNGIGLLFAAPHSFTGEDVLELQGHGGPVILDLLLEACLTLGARQARPGEFSERAYLNDKLDLSQAEAIADLIDASSKQAAANALNTLVGEFSKKINTLVANLIELRLYVESAIDFPEEEIDFLNDGKVAAMLENLIIETLKVQSEANQGLLIKEGMKVVIAGKPNAGKSSLLNALAEKDVAIVTEIAGTTRDMLRESIQIDGMPLHIIDTAGLRKDADLVESIGIERAHAAIKDADQILLLVDVHTEGAIDLEVFWSELGGEKAELEKITLIYNKIDKLPLKNFDFADKSSEIALSAQTGEGLDKLKQRLKSIMGFRNMPEGQFSARRRHLQALSSALLSLEHGKIQLRQHAAGELLAEDLRDAQNKLSEITGQFTPDDLLGKIFSSFCIGK